MTGPGPNGAATRTHLWGPVPEMAQVETVVTFLEMKAEPLLHIAPPLRLKLMLMRAEKPDLAFFRYLYGAVGHSAHWQYFGDLSDTDLSAIIHDDRVEIWVAHVNGQPGGFFMVDARPAPAHVELELFGLLPQFQGLGLARWLLAEAIRACWASKPERVIVETSTLDSPHALTLYQKLGFVAYDRKVKMVEIKA